jgi:hypothetical protein
MPLISIGTGHLLYGGDFFADWKLFLCGFAGVYIIGFFSWYLHVVSMHMLAALMPDLSQTLPRLVILAAVHIVLITLTMVVYFYGFDAVGYLGYVLDPVKFRWALWLGVLLTLIATSVWQVEHIFSKWRESLAQKELIEQQRLVQEYEALKRQINPHFLFNNLNILSSLITDDPARAEYFLDELSKVYRYMLKNNEEGITDLRSELTFIGSYFALIGIRHGHSVRLELEVDERYLDMHLPAFSLQLLVENAVKHNVATRVSPLYISIATTNDGSLKVGNNLQRKKGGILSNNIGLSNISENYRLLVGRELQVIEDGASFTVILPLIKFENKK